MTHDNIQYYDIINWCKVDAHPSILSVPYCQVPGTVDSLGGLLQPLNHPSLGNQQEGGGSWILQPLIFISIKLITHHFNFAHNWNCSTQDASSKIWNLVWSWPWIEQYSIIKNQKRWVYTGRLRKCSVFIDLPLQLLFDIVSSAAVGRGSEQPTRRIHLAVLMAMVSAWPWMLIFFNSFVSALESDTYWILLMLIKYLFRWFFVGKLVMILFHNCNITLTFQII